MSTPLTPRELEVLGLLVETHGDRDEIASRLGVSKATIKTFLGFIYAKLHVSNCLGAVIEGMRQDLIPLP